MKKSLLLLLLIFWFTSGFTQEKWSQDARMMSIDGDKTSITEPDYLNLNYINPNTSLNVVKTMDGDAIVFPNYRVHPSVYTQSEVPIISHPTNKNIIFGSANWFNSAANMFSEGVYVTTNGGDSWFGWDTLRAAPLTDHVGDPAPSIDMDGRFYMSYLQRGGGGGIYASNSTDYGNTWANATLVTSVSSDKNHTVTINNPASPYNGYTIVTWSNFAATNPNIVAVVTTNHGSTWSSIVTVQTPPSGVYSQGVNAQQGPNGEVYMVWQSPMAGSPFTGKYVGFAKSTNGGFNWTVNNNVYTCNGIRGTLLFGSNSIRVNDFPWMGVDLTNGARRGWIYVVTAEKNLAPAGADADIVLHKSTDGGTTWSAGIRVNQDPLSNGKFQYMPAMVVGTDGSVNVVFYDNRNNTADSVDVYMARSLDGGTTWSEIKVSDHKFKPASISGLATGYQGDYIGIAEGPNGSMFPYWADNKSGIYQAWTTKVLFGPTMTHAALTNTENLAGPYKVGVNITSSVPLNENKVFLYWTRGTTFDSLLMTKVAPDSFVANIPGNGSSATYRYYIYSADTGGGYATSPAGAPTSYHSFVAATDIVPPAITHTVIGDQFRELWPASITANVTDNIGIDSVWVSYKVKFNGTQRQFKLAAVAGNNYSGLFNIDTSLIAIGDTMYYRIIAKDASAAHNLGYFPSSTDYNTFKFKPDTDFPVVTHTAMRDQAKIRWPSRVTANVTDNLGVASVKVEYKINDGIIRNFDLTANGSAYTGFFNVDSSLVQIGDTIFYKVMATDVSTMHNVTSVPAAGYNAFKIINTKGVVLVVNDDVTLEGRESPNEDSPLGASSGLISATLINAGYVVDSVKFVSLIVADLQNYDIVVLSTGAKSTSILEDAAKRTAIINYVNNGGKTWVEGGQVGYVYRKSGTTTDKDPVFRRIVLNDSAWVSSATSSTLTMKDPAHPIFNYPNVLTGSFAFTGTSSYTRDVMTLGTGARPGTRKAACWSQYPDTAGIIIRFEGNDPSDIRNVFFAFNAAMMTNQVTMAKLIENTAEALMSGPPTPVELTAFTADVNNGIVDLKWITATELNNLGFEIQRSSNYLNYEKVGYVSGMGTSTDQHNYSFADSKLQDGAYAYRLKQIDLDGSFAYSPAIEVNVINPVVYALEQNYPNPFNPSTIIKYSIPQDGLVTLNVFNVLGERVMTLVNVNMKAGKYEVVFNASSLASGIYLYRLESGTFTSVKKMLLVK